MCSDDEYAYSSAMESSDIDEDDMLEDDIISPGSIVPATPIGSSSSSHGGSENVYFVFYCKPTTLVQYNKTFFYRFLRRVTL